MNQTQINMFTEQAISLLHLIESGRLTRQEAQAIHDTALAVQWYADAHLRSLDAARLLPITDGTRCLPGIGEHVTPHRGCVLR